MNQFSKTKEFSDLMSTFERTHKHLRLDREKPEGVPAGNWYQSGVTNDIFKNYLEGYMAGRCVYQSDAEEARAALAAKEQELRDAYALAYIGEHRFPDLTWKSRAAEMAAALAAKDAEIEKLKAEIETLAWNLGGISTLACSRKLVEFDSSMARPALHDVAALVKDYASIASNAAPEQKPEQKQKQKQKPETCAWTPAEVDGGAGSYKTGCGHYRILNAFSLDGCPVCGKRVEVKP